MSFQPRSEVEKLLCGVTLTPITRLGKAIKAAMESIESAVELPTVSNTDNGKFLGVSSGKWKKVNGPSAAPFELSGTLGQNDQNKGTMTFTETAAELYALCQTGRKCKLLFTVSDTPMEVLCDIAAIKDGSGNSATYAFIIETTAVYAASNLSGDTAVVLNEQ